MINLKKYRTVELNNGNFALQLITGYLWWKKPSKWFLDLLQYKADGQIKHLQQSNNWFADCQAHSVADIEEILLPPGPRPGDVKRVVNGTKLDKVLK